MFTSRVAANGQITLPREVRQALKVKSGQRLQFSVEPDGVLIQAAQPSQARSLAGSLGRYARVTTEARQARALVKKEVARAAAQTT